MTWRGQQYGAAVPMLVLSLSTLVVLVSGKGRSRSGALELGSPLISCSQPACLRNPSPTLVLQGCVFTNDINQAIRISDAMETGSVQVGGGEGGALLPGRVLRDMGHWS